MELLPRLSDVKRTIDYDFKIPPLLNKALYASGSGTFIGGKMVDESNRKIATVGRRVLDLWLEGKVWRKDLAIGTLVSKPF